jgi:hypothetical protein
MEVDGAPDERVFDVDPVPNGDLEEGMREEYGLAKEATPEDEEVEEKGLMVRGWLSFLYQQRS